MWIVLLQIAHVLISIALIGLILIQSGVLKKTVLDLPMPVEEEPKKKKKAAETAEEAPASPEEPKQEMPEKPAEPEQPAKPKRAAKPKAKPED